MSHLKKAPNSDWTCIPTGNLKIKMFRNRCRQQFSRDDRTRPVYLFLPVVYLIFLPFFLRKTTISSAFPNLLQEGDISDCWIYHLTVHYVRDPWVIPVTNLSLVPKAIVSYTHKPMDITYQVKLLWTDVPRSCFNLFPAITIQVN